MPDYIRSNADGAPERDLGEVNHCHGPGGGHPCGGGFRGKTTKQVGKQAVRIKKKLRALVQVTPEPHNTTLRKRYHRVNPIALRHSRNTLWGTLTRSSGSKIKHYDPTRSRVKPA